VDDYKLDELLIDTSCRGLIDQIHVKELKNSVNAFTVNINRLAALAQLPVSLFYWGSAAGQNYVVAYQDIMKKMYEFSTPAESYADKSDVIDERARDWTSGLVKRFQRDKEDWAEVAGDSHKQMLRLLPPEVPLSEGTEAILFSVVIGAWTAFETLVSDVWIGAYDALPREAKGQEGDQLRIQNKMNPDSEVQASVRKKAEKFQDDSGLSGEELVDEKEMWFSRLDWTRQHYSRLFSEKLQFAKTTAIDDALMNIRLDGVNLVRNLLIHKAGIADATYVEDSKLYPLAPQLDPKQA